MTATELREWRARMSLSQQAAANALGCAKTSIANYESGRYEIPQYIALACTALAWGLPPMGSPGYRHPPL